MTLSAVILESLAISVKGLADKEHVNIESKPPHAATATTAAYTILTQSSI